MNSNNFRAWRFIMGDGIKRDRAGVIPYIIYILYTTYMTVVSVTFGWPSWITAVINCGLFAEFGLNIIMGYRKSYYLLNIQ